MYSWTVNARRQYGPSGLTEASLQTIFERSPAIQLYNGVEAVANAYYPNGTWDDPEVHSRAYDAWVLQNGLIDLVERYRNRVQTMPEYEGDRKFTRTGEEIWIGHTQSKLRAGIRMRVLFTGKDHTGQHIDIENPDFQPVEITLQQLPTHGIEIMVPGSNQLVKSHVLIVPVMISPVVINSQLNTLRFQNYYVQMPSWTTLVRLMQAR